MGAFTTTKRDICNMALRLLGDSAITSAELTAAENGTTVPSGSSAGARRADICQQFYDNSVNATLEDHPWNFAMVRTSLLAYTRPATTLTPGSGATTLGTTGVTFTAGSGVFTSCDRFKVLSVGQSGPGQALITGFTSSLIVTATITQAFANLTAISSGSWRLYYAKPTGADYSFSIPYPDDALRIWRTEFGERYQVEYNTCSPGVYLICDQEVLTLRYIRQATCTIEYPPVFVRAIAARLAMDLAEPLTGQVSKQDRARAAYMAALQNARKNDGMEGTPEPIRSNELVSVRYGGGHGRTRTGWRWWET